MGDINSERFEFGDVTVDVQIDSPGIDDDQPYADRTSDSQTSTVTSTVVPSNAESPAMAMGSSYEMLSQSMCLLALNAVNTQKQLTMTQQTVTNQELQQAIAPKPQPSTLTYQNSLDSLQGIVAVLTSLSK